MEPRLLVLLALTSVVTAVPITIDEYSNNCAKECTPSTTYNYAPGTTYLYNYRVDTVTSMSGASEDQSKLTITARAEIEVTSACEMALILRDTRLFHSDANGGLQAAEREDYIRRGLETSALRFSFQNGVVKHVCSGSREEPWAMNIKKGALSAFQNSMDDVSQNQNVTETDVTGTCETQYKVVSTGYYTNTVKKVKDILTCTDRHDFRTMIQMVPYAVPSEIQSIPIMKTSHQCTQAVQKGGVLKSSTCTESHVYRPFSNGQDGGVTVVTQTLTYNTHRRDVTSSQDTITNRDSLLFDHSATRPDAEQARHQVELKLKEICDVTAFDVRPESPRLFSELVSALKALDKQVMEEILYKLKTKSLCPSNNKAYMTYLDALPATGTSASVSLMTSLIVNEDIKDLQARAWIVSFAFIQAPTSEMILEAKQLIDNGKFREDSLLPVTSMVNNLCNKQAACDQSFAVMSILSSLERALGDSCYTNSKNRHEILLVLRAVGNAGHSTRIVPTINKCLTSTYNPLEIRVAAAEAFRRLPCEANADDLWQTYESNDLDSELRIAAYLALIRCPHDVTLARLSASLDGDLDAHVGAFVYSHLTNLRESSDPHKQNVAQAMENLYIPNKFASNPVKASSNLEASVLLNKINAGFVAESNLVWSSTAQLPRSASANLTIELFGQSVNLVDFGGRFEGLEYLITNLFGPPLGVKDPNAKEKDMYGSIYGRMFGNEMIYAHTEELRGSLKFFNKYRDVLKALSQQQDFAITHSAQIMDARMVIPTVAGLPIHVDVNGSAVVDLVLTGKADLRRLAKNPMSIEVDGEIRPSAALEITGTMSVDATVTKAGLRMRNTLHSSTSLKGRIQVEGGKLLSVELDSPKDKIEIFDARSKFFIVHNKFEKEQKMITENRREFKKCTNDKLADITGVVLCGEVSFPNASMQSEGPYFPLTGPSSASLVLDKTDTHSGYKLLVKSVQNKRMNLAQISFNTPGSRVNRVILIDLSLDKDSNAFDAHMVTPWKKATLAGALALKPHLVSAIAKATIDDKDVYGLTSEMKISQSKKKIHLSPIIEIVKPGMDKIQLTGFISADDIKSLKLVEMDLALSGLKKLPYIFKTTVTNTKKETSMEASVSDDGDKSRYSLATVNRLTVTGKKVTVLHASNTFKLSSPKKDLVSIETSVDYKEDKSLKLEGTIDIDRLMRKPASIKVDYEKNAKKHGARYEINGNIKSAAITGRIDSSFHTKSSGFVSAKTSLDYLIPKVAKNKIVLNGKFNDRSTNAYTKYTMKGNMDVRKNPEYNLGVDFDFDHKKKRSEAELQIKYGPDFRDANKRIYLNTALSRVIPNYKNVVLKYNVKAAAPEHNINLALEGKHEHNRKMVDSDIHLNYGPEKDLKAAVFYKDSSKKLSKVSGRMSVAWPGAEYVLSSKLDQRSPRHISHDIFVKEKGGDKHSMESVYKMDNSGNRVFKSDINLKGLKKIGLTGSTNVGGKTPHASAELTYGKDIYGLSTKAKKSKNPGGTVIFEVVHPERRMLMKLEGEKTAAKHEGSIEASWDADKDKSKKITLGGSVYNKLSDTSVSLGGDLALTSPFENFKDLAGSFKYGSDNSQHDATGKISWGGRHKQVVSTMSLKKPISLSHFVGSIETNTPFRKARFASAEIQHNWDKSLNTIVKGNLNKENAKLIVQGEGSLDNLKGSVDFSSSIKRAESISGSLSHKLNNGKLASKASLNHNRNSYGYDFNIEHSANGLKVKNVGDLILISPKNKVSTSWKHKNSDKKVKSTLSSQWGKKKLSIYLAGSQDLSSEGTVEGELKIESPWKSMRDVVVSLNHKHGNEFINSNALLKHNHDVKAKADVKYMRSDGRINSEINLKSPFHNDLSGKVNANYNTFPKTTNVELQWHPSKKISAEASLEALSLENASFDLKLTTPSHDYRNIALKASHKRKGPETISHANLDWGKRQNIDIETRYALNEKNKMARLRFSAPFEQIKSLETGMRFDGETTDFDSSADFELVPHVGKFQGSAKWHYNDDITGSLRLDTPFEDYPYFELSTYSKEKGKARKSYVEAKVHPQQVYSLDTTYSFTLPISFEATVNSPYPEYNDLGLVIQHNHSPYTVDSRGELRYMADKKIESFLIADWSSNIDGSLIVKTPFSGYESNKLAFRHQGDADDFSSHGEAHVAEQSVIADASFKSGYTTTGTFSLSSPIPGMETISLDVKKRGKGKHLRGEVTLHVNDQKFDADYHHKLNKELLKAGFKLVTPYTENLKLSFNHNGMLTKFTNEIAANYGRKYQLDTDVSFDHSHPDMNGQGTLKYKLGKRKNTARVNFNKQGEIQDMNFRGSAAFNDEEISVDGAWKSKNDLEGNVQISTPFEGFKSTGMTLSHAGKMDDFRSSAGVTFMDGKTITGRVTMSNNGLQSVYLDSEIATPFEKFPSASVTVNHNYDKRANIINGEASLTTPVADFGTGSVTYDKVGSIENLAASTTAKRNGRQVASLKLSNVMNDLELHSKLETEAVEYPDFSMSLDHAGDVSNFNTKGAINLGEDKVFGEVSKRGPINDINVSGTAGYNEKSVEVRGDWNNKRGVDGSLGIKTPFENFKDIGMSISHSGNKSDFTTSGSVEYMDDKTISGKVELSTIDSVRFVSELNTPFKGYENTRIDANGLYDDNKDLNARVSLSSTINDFGNGEAFISKSGSLDNLVVDGSVLRNNIELGNVKLTNVQNENDINTAFNVRGSAVRDIEATLTHSGGWENFSTKTRASIDKKNTIENELTFNVKETTLNANGMIRYDIENIGSNVGSLRIEKEGDLDDISITIVGHKNGEDYRVNGQMKLDPEMTGTLSIKTPIEGYTNVGVSFSHNGNCDQFNATGKINLVDGQDYKGKIDFYRNKWRVVHTALEINTPIKDAEYTKLVYKHEGQKKNIHCSAVLEYGQSKKITYDLSAATKPNVDFSIIVKTPFENYEDLMASASVDNNWPKLTAKSKLNAGEGRVFTVDGSLDASKDINGELTATTPFENFSKVGLSFDHSGKLKNFKSGGRVTYMDDQEISGTVTFKLRRSFLSAELKTPFSGYEYTKGEFRQSTTDFQSTTTSSLIYGDNKLVSSETVITFQPKPGFSVTIKTPVENYETLTASASVDNSWPKIDFTSKASAGIDRQIAFDASFDATNDISGLVELVTPIENFTKVGLSFLHAGDSQKFDSEGKITYMDGQDISGKVTFYKYMMRRVVATAEISTPFKGAKNTKAEFNYEDNSNSISTTAALEYGKGQKLDGNMKLTHSPNYEALVTINTPLENYKVIRALGFLDINTPSYSAGYNFDYGHNNVYSANGKLNLYSLDNIDGSLEVALPVEGAEFTKAEYKHKFDTKRLEGSATLIYGNSKTISGEVTASNSPNYEATVNIKTPFEGYENLRGSANYENSYDKYEASSSLNLANGESFAMSSSLDISSEPIRASVQLSTPYTDYRNMELVLTKEGQMKDFHVTGFLASPLTDNINAEANLKYNSPTDMEASASLKSSFNGMDDLLAEIKNSDASGEKKTHAVVGWTSGQKIILDGIFHQKDGWYEKKTVSDLSLSTPFVAVSSVSAQMEHTDKENEAAQLLTFELNGDKLLDMDTEFSFKKKNKATVTFRKPRAMKYTLSTGSKDGVSEAEIEANWDRNAKDSSVRISTTVDDKSDSYNTDRNVRIGVTHASRTMGLDHKITNSRQQTTSLGKIYWDSDDASKVSYDMALIKGKNHRGKTRHGYLTIGLPSRTLLLQGSSSDNNVKRIGDLSFSWNAERADEKIGIKGTMTRGDPIKGDITLSMPFIRKEIRVDGELMAQNGRVILDARTDISYSEDARKTLTLTSKLEDISDSYSYYNYSLAVGVSHPYTNVDIQMNSHLGRSGEKMTVGLNTDYMTARRQNKNLGLLAEINKLKREINLQIVNPINKVEIIGNVISTSPYKVQLVNKVDDVEISRSSLMVDSDKKAVELQMLEGSEGVKISAGYPNSTAFHSEVRRISYGREMTEALLAARLNSSRLLHSRVHWDLELIQKARQNAKERGVIQFGVLLETWDRINAAIADEIDGKYRDITSHISEELTPLVDELEKELKQATNRMIKLSKKMKQAYENNDFYVQELGEVYVEAQEKLMDLSREYKKQSNELIASLREGLQKMISYPIKDVYTRILRETETAVLQKMMEALNNLEVYMARVEEVLAEYSQKIAQTKQDVEDSIYNATYETYISDRLGKLRNIDLSGYVPQVPADYTDAIYSAHEMVGNYVGDVLEAPGLRYVKGGVNEIYQQGVWAYNYWEVENFIQRHAENIVKLIQEIIKEELKEYVKDINPITVWDPKNGELQADFPLPIDVYRLDEVPDMTPITDKVVAYVPDGSTLEKVSEYLPVWSNETGDEEEAEVIKKYRPSRRFRKYKGRKVYRQ